MSTRVLVIEDNEELLSDIVEMLSMEGFEILTAHNGRVGIDVAEREVPDLIVCDVRMPVMDGYDVLDYIRSNTRTRNIPFIFLTARTGRSEFREGMKMGADDYLTKPFSAEELIASIRSRLVRSKDAQDETERRLDELRHSIALALPHEMRTPLNAILGFSEILMTDHEKLEKPQTLEMARHINEAAYRLYRLVENYVVYANLELMRNDEKQREFLKQGRTEYVDILIDQEVRQRALHHQREDDLVTDIESIERAIAIDTDNFSRMIHEVADNAFKFSEAGDSVIVQVYPDGNDLIVRIRDEGYGFRPEEIESVGAYMQFKRAFFEQQGIGFGLTIATRMAEVHGGSLRITSERGTETDVIIRLPFAT